MSVGSPRRYYLLKARFHETMGDKGLAAAFRAKHLEAGGEELPADFPSAAALAAAVPPYTTVEDLSGADARELVKYAGLTRAEAEAVLSAIEN